MPSSLADPFLKTVRAMEHLEDLRERLRTFREEGPCTFRRERDHKKGLYILRFKFNPIPDSVPLIVGDFLYCLRSSLDQLVWALAKRVGTYPSHTQFPIFLVWNTQNERKFEKYTEGVPTKAVAIIDSLQPYRVPDPAARRSHLLWQLHLLSNIDKHRRIPVDASIIEFGFRDFPRKFLPQVRFDHEAEMITAPLELEPYMKLDPEGSFDVTFGDSYEGIKCNTERLEQMYEFVTEGVLPRFAQFFS
jgi:hypothetical protein